MSLYGSRKEINSSCSRTHADSKMLAVLLVLLCALPHISTGSGEVLTHSVEKAVWMPRISCMKSNEGETFHSPGREDIMWVCRNESWTPHSEVPSIGSGNDCPGMSCKEIRDTSPAANTGMYWVNKTEPCMMNPPQIIKVYCDMALDGGGWTLVWKHSYMEVEPLTEDMKYFSTFYKPCTDLESGWCNIPQKNSFHPTEMMIVAYHNKSVVYAYKGDYNLNMDKDWYGGILFNPVKIVDTCLSHAGTPPDPNIEGGLGGLAFDKESPGIYTVNCDTIRGSLSSHRDCRFENCNTYYNQQMTMAIFIR